MARDIRVKALVCLVVIGLVGAPARGADPPRHERRLSREVGGVVTAALHLLRNVWGKEGSSLDPFGRPTQGTQAGTPAPPQDEATGSTLDPFGKP
jgi:hypothetical protein